MNDKDELKTISFRSGTKQEIVEYLRRKVKGILGEEIMNSCFGNEEDKFLPIFKIGDLYEDINAPFETQIDEKIKGGFPIVRIVMWEITTMPNCKPGRRYESFLVTDASEISEKNQLKMDEENYKEKFMMWLDDAFTPGSKLAIKFKQLSGIKK